MARRGAKVVRASLQQLPTLEMTDLITKMLSASLAQSLPLTAPLDPACPVRKAADGSWDPKHTYSTSYLAIGNARPNCADRIVKVLVTIRSGFQSWLAALYSRPSNEAS